MAIKRETAELNVGEISEVDPLLGSVEGRGQNTSPEIILYA